MTPQQRLQSPQKEGRLLLVSQAYESRRVRSQYRVAQLYSVPRTTLRRRPSGARPKAVAHIYQCKLQDTEEQPGRLRRRVLLLTLISRLSLYELFSSDSLRALQLKLSRSLLKVGTLL